MALQIQFDPRYNDFDLVVGDHGFTVEAGLETAVIVSLFTDSRARPGDAKLDPEDDDLRGFWGDIYSDVQGSELGSLLWLLDRSTSRQEVFRLANERGTAALAWMVDDGIADSAVVVSSREGPGRLGLRVTITRERDALRWEKQWTATINGI
jgi:phage gp46-like protein